MTDAAPDYHIPVLLQATVDGLNVRPDGCYVDCTFGGGGHSREILRRLGPDGRLLAFDQDADAQRNIPAGEDRLTFVQSNFRYLPNWLHYYGYEQVDGILADLGVSSHHFDAADRGFSFRFEGVLDMRMNKSARTSAADVVNTYSEEQLAKLFYLYGELNNGRRLAAAIVKARAAAQIARVEQLVDIVTPYLGAARAKKDMAKVFQALRIEVNHEIGGYADGRTDPAEAGRPIVSFNLPFIGRSLGEKFHQSRQRCGQSRTRLLRKPTRSDETPERARDKTRRG